MCSAINSYFHALQVLFRSDSMLVFEHPDSNTAAIVDVETTTNDAMPGRWCFKVDVEGSADACQGVII